MSNHAEEHPPHCLALWAQPGQSLRQPTISASANGQTCWNLGEEATHPILELHHIRCLPFHPTKTLNLQNCNRQPLGESCPSIAHSNSPRPAAIRARGDAGIVRWDSPTAPFSLLWNQLDLISPTSCRVCTGQPPSRHGRWLGWEQLQQMVDSLGHQPAQLWETSQISL